MNSPSCQTTSQMRGVFTSFTLPSFENILFYSLGKIPDRGRVLTVPQTSTIETGLLSALSGCQTSHNTVVAVRLARTLACCNYACVTSGMRQQKQWTIDDRILHRSLTIRLVFTLVLLMTFPACKSDQKMNQNTQSGSSLTETTNNDPISIHRRAIAIDMHADTAQRLLDENVDLQQALSDGHFDAVRAKAGGLDAQFFSIWVEPQLFGATGVRAMKRADDQIAAVRDLAEKHPETWALATSADDIRAASAAGKMAALLGLEGGYAIDERLENVQRYYDLGVRYLSPAWSVSTS